MHLTRCLSRLGVTAVLAAFAMPSAACVQESPGSIGVVVRNDTAGPVRVTFLSESPRATTDPINPGTSKASFIPFGEACEPVQEYGVIDGSDRLIAKSLGSCTLENPWVLSDPALVVRNDTPEGIRVGPSSEGPASATPVSKGGEIRVPIDPDDTGCDRSRAVTAWSSAGRVLATREVPCVADQLAVR